MKTLSKIFLTTISLFFLGATKAQDLGKEEVKSAVESRAFKFVAQTAYPTGGAARQLTSGYDVIITGDSLVVYLPYFGRAYNAPMTGEGGLKLTTTDYSYKAKAKKNDSWEVNINPQEQTDIRLMTFRIFENGQATLQVSSLNRQPINFSGYIVMNK